MKKKLLSALLVLSLASCDRPQVRIEVGVGRNAVTYYTDGYRRDGDCIHFVSKGDSVHACGPYSMSAR